MFCQVLITFAIATLAPSAVRADTPDPNAPPMVGGYSPTELTPELSSMLYTTLANTTLYDASVTARVCIKSISSVESQVVAGENYRYTTVGCDLGQSLPSSQQSSQYFGRCVPDVWSHCKEVEATIVIYQSLDASVTVKSIKTTAKNTAVRNLRG